MQGLRSLSDVGAVAQDAAVQARVKAKVRDLTSAFPLY
jgi:hypothetical protein